MVGIREGQKRIRKGQKEAERAISKIDLMFQIVRARAENDAAKDATLTQTLTELMTKQNMGKTMACEEKHGQD
uniref:Uncharacterized protein n=1 Tax=Salix viminalis TaxID=40686 RepID=A0A6N2NLL9_SALVM